MTNLRVYGTEITSRKFLERIVKQKVVIDRLVALHKEEKAALEASIEPGWKSEIMNEFGGKLGTVSLSNPARKLVIEDPAVAFVDYPGELEYSFVNFERDKDLIFNILEEYAPEVLTLVATAGDLKDITDKHERVYRATGEVPAGWTVVQGTPRLTLRATETAREFAAQFLDNLGNPVLGDMRKAALESKVAD